LIAQSQSGTGKTAAFVLAMLSRVDPEFQYPQVIRLEYFANDLFSYLMPSKSLFR